MTTETTRPKLMLETGAAEEWHPFCDAGRLATAADDKVAADGYRDGLEGRDRLAEIEDGADRIAYRAALASGRLDREIAERGSVAVATKAQAPAKPHRFAHLANPRYVYTGMSEETYQACPGAPVQASGTCDHCGTCIRYAFHFRGSDGRTFKLGCDCATHTDDGGKAEDSIAREVRLAKRELDRKLRAPKIEAQRAKKASQAVAALESAREILKSDPVRAALAAIPHPIVGLADRGKTRLDWAEYLVNELRAPAQVAAFVGMLDYARA